MSKITVSRVAVGNSGSIVEISSDDLVGALQRDEAGTIDTLSKQYAPVQPDDVTVDSSGTITIRNKAFVDALLQQAAETRSPPQAGWLDVGCNCSHNLVACGW
jgi:hypothetical protein